MSFNGKSGVNQWSGLRYGNADGKKLVASGASRNADINEEAVFRLPLMSGIPRYVMSAVISRLPRRWNSPIPHWAEWISRSAMPAAPRPGREFKDFNDPPEAIEWGIDVNFKV